MKRAWKSKNLKKNPLGDPSERHNYVLLPNGTNTDLPLIFHLSGYFSTGYSNFNPKTLNKNFVQKIDDSTQKGLFAKAIHVFVEATTWWGGSQFINSAGCGNYSDYILKDLYKACLDQLPATHKSQKTCVMGGSSGGYGALHLVSLKSSPFGVAFATAPDSFFEASLLPELFSAAPELAKYKSISQVVDVIDQGEIQDKKSFFTLANVLAMAHCYSPASAFKKGWLEFPIDLNTGEINKSLWSQWLKHDPVHFLKKRKANLKGKKIFLDVGKYDNFSLQFGTRQIAENFKKDKIKYEYTEFPGNHFGLSQRRLDFLANMKKKW